MDSESSCSASEIEGCRQKEFLKGKGRAKEKGSVKEKPKAKKKRPGGKPTIAERMHSVQKHIDEIEISSVAQLAASAKEWLRDMELIRSKTTNTMQGSLNGKLRERIGILNKVLDTFAVRLEEKGDVA